MFKPVMNENLSLLQPILQDAFHKRRALLHDTDTNAYRLFNGFYEGCRAFSIDRYGNTAVILWTDRKTGPSAEYKDFLCGVCLENVPGIENVLLKNRYAKTEEEKKGILLAGQGAEHHIREWGTSYSINLQLNKDCGFYLDSALLRKWLLANAKGKRVLNTFAYTGSLGDAAEAGDALSVTQTDVNRNYLSNHSKNQEYILGDFFHVSASLRRSGRLFDIILLDPPFFANSSRNAKVDQAKNAAALINKIRPLAAHNGKIIAINNALFLSGKDYLEQLQNLCDEYLSIGEIIPVPGSFFGCIAGNPNTLPADPSPFNHPTKIVVLEVKRKDERQ